MPLSCLEPRAGSTPESNIRDWWGTHFVFKCNCIPEPIINDLIFKNNNEPSKDGTSKLILVLYAIRSSAYSGF